MALLEQAIKSQKVFEPKNIEHGIMNVKGENHYSMFKSDDFAGSRVFRESVLQNLDLKMLEQTISRVLFLINIRQWSFSWDACCQTPQATYPRA